ncbi:MAG TPA: DUF5916 domain-containing protein [Vicinamibacterales bacterium]|nr:DUF5916 domain-containing protein [Vicinamibacterales bacterium]
MSGPARSGIALIALMAVASGAFAQAGPSAAPVIVATEIPDGMTMHIDGALDEPVWERAAAVGTFRQRDPDNGAPATERTSVRIVYDSSRLIIGATLFDDDPSGIRGNQMQRDGGFDSDDRFIVTLDTFLDGRNGYFFQVNPLGALLDGLVDPSTKTDFGAGVNTSWDGIWTAHVTRGSDRWTAEIEIPFRSLNFSASARAWGINFQRTVRRKNEEALWTAYDRNLGVARMASAGRLEGLHGLTQGLGLDLKPFGVGKLAAAPGFGRPGAVSTGSAGFDALYNITPALRAQASVNTDFAETEVDQRQVNLTQFPLFFPEKRDFFLQGANYFDFARELGNQVTPFFSRRIGLDDLGQPQPIDAGAKLTGQAGAFDVGILQVRTRDTNAQTGSDVSVARVRRRFFAESYVGGLFTRRADRAPGARSLETLGFDGSLRTSRFLTNKTVDLSWWYLHTTNPIGTGQSGGQGARLQFPNDPLFLDFSYRELQPNYDPAVGFLQRRGFRRFNPEMRYTWHFENGWVRSEQMRFDYEFVNDPHNRALTRTFDTKLLTLVFKDGSTFEAQASPIYDRLDGPFQLSNSLVLPAGRAYWFTRYMMTGTVAPQHVVSGGATMVRGSFYSGRRSEYDVNIGVRPRRGVAVNVSEQHNIVDLAEGHLTTDVFELTASTQFSPWISLANDVQYDSVSRTLGWQARFRWIERPGNDLYVVYTHNWQDVLERVGPAHLQWLDSRLATKIVYTLRF